MDGSRNILFRYIPWPKNSKGWQTADTAGAAAANVFDGPDVGQEASSSTLKREPTLRDESRMMRMMRMMKTSQISHVCFPLNHAGGNGLWRERNGKDPGPRGLVGLTH